MNFFFYHPVSGCGHDIKRTDFYKEQAHRAEQRQQQV